MANENRPYRLPGLPRSKRDWGQFDAMPWEWKEVCIYGLTPRQATGWQDANLQAVKRDLAERERRSTLLVYGPDHPQAGLPAEGVTPSSRGACNPTKRNHGDQTMKTYAFDFAKQCIKAFESKQDARNAGNGLHLASTPEEFLEFRVTAHEITALYNRLVPEAPVQKFQDKATAAKRMIALAEAKAQLIAPAIPAGDAVKETDEMAKIAARNQKSETKASRPKRKVLLTLAALPSSPARS